MGTSAKSTRFVRSASFWTYSTWVILAASALMTAVSTVVVAPRLLNLAGSANVVAWQNSIWHVAQIRSEYQRFQIALSHAIDRNPDQLDEVRERYDIFYSRYETLVHGAMFNDLRDTNAYRSAATEISGFLETATPYFDASDEDLRAGLSIIEHEANTANDALIAFYLATQRAFAARSRAARAEIRHASRDLKYALGAGLVLLLLASASLLRFYLVSSRRQRLLERARTAAETNELALRTSEGDLQEAQRIGRIGHWRLNKDGQVFPSAEMFRIFAVDPTDFDGTAAAFIARIHPDDQSEVNSQYELAWTQPEALNFVHRIIYPDGEQRVMRKRVRSTQNESGTISQLFATVQDITEERKNQEEREALLEEAHALNAKLQRFASIAAHDLQEPLRKMILMSSELNAALDDREYDRALHAGEVIEQSAERARDLVRALLTYSRAEAAAPDLKPINLRSILDGVLDTLSATIAETDARIELRVPLDAQLTADPNQLSMILTNLIGNSLRYSKSDVTPEVVVTLDTASDTQDKILCVADNGIGFDAKMTETMFLPFVRLHSQSGRHGTGIGLAICKTFCDHHRWDLSARSNPGKGSAFSIRIPVDQAA